MAKKYNNTCVTSLIDAPLSTSKKSDENQQFFTNFLKKVFFSEDEQQASFLVVCTPVQSFSSRTYQTLAPV